MNWIHRVTRGARILLGIGLVALCGMQNAMAADEEGINVNVSRNGDDVVIDLDFVVPVAPHDAWEVLVDYDHMTNFLSNLKVSRIQEQHGNHLKVEQKGESSRAGISFAFESVREIDLVPDEKVTSRAISGTIKKLEATTSLHPQSDGTHIEYHSVSLPNVWLPPVIGTSIVGSEARKQFAEIRAEILRRKAAEKS